MDNRVSIHVCTRDRFSELAMLLLSLREQTFTNWDLVIVDGSQPNPIFVSKFLVDITNRMKMEGHGITYVRENFPQGVIMARNTAIQSDNWSNPLILRVDDDSVCDRFYLEKLVKLIESKPDAGAVGGVVPLFGQMEIVRNSERIDVFSKITFDSNGNVSRIGDDLGFCYEPNIIKQAHHLRSSFLFKKEAVEKVGMFPVDYGKYSFREESDFCIRILMAGYELWVDTSAINWHLLAQSGGARGPDYFESVQVSDAHFKRKLSWWKRSGKLNI